MDLNKVSLIGNMVRDAEQSTLASGQSVTRFSIATNYAWQDSKTKVRREAVDFHDVVAWGKLGDIIKKYVKRGSKLYIEGRLRQRVFTDKAGQRRSKAEVIADNLIMLGNKPSRAAADKLIKDDVYIEQAD